MSTPTPPPPPARRCLTCYYVLDNLPSTTCPECGRPFHPDDPTSYTTKPPFVWWQFWLPAFLLAAGGGAVLYLLLTATVGFTCATTIVLPFAVGTVAGYVARIGRVVTIILVLGALAAVFLLSRGAGITGAFCTVVLAGLAIGPAMVGATAGVLLRTSLKRYGRFSQRDYLPVLLLLLIPIFAALIEGRRPNLPIITLHTSQIIDAPPDVAWRSVMFYEEVHHQPPWLLRHLLPRPLYATGRSTQVGDTKTCVYSKGRLTKRVTAADPNHRLAFDVIEQFHIENDSVRLLDGSFDFEPLDHGRRTRVTLTTRYQPLLAPRLAFQPFESLAVHTLHGHVLLGMSLHASDLQHPPTTQPTPTP